VGIFLNLLGWKAWLPQCGGLSLVLGNSLYLDLWLQGQGLCYLWEVFCSVSYGAMPTSFIVHTYSLAGVSVREAAPVHLVASQLFLSEKFSIWKWWWRVFGLCPLSSYILVLQVLLLS